MEDRRKSINDAHAGSAQTDVSSPFGDAALTPVPDPSATPVVDVAKSTSAPPPAKVDPYVGKTFDGRYSVDAILGEGGMGVVYKGRHKVIDKKVAIKVLRGDMARDKEITERFLQEAKAASSIGNPHIIDISDFGTLPDGSTYFVMEYLDGKSLTAAMNESRPVPVPRLIHIAKQIAAALSAAHEAGIVHRDLKPDNIMLVNRGRDKDFVKILDFGIAKVGGEASRLTRAGSVFGTPHYMSPEQAAGTPVDQRTDIYSLGVILYEAASGKVPFDADNFMGILTQHMYKSPVRIRDLVPAPDVPHGLDAIIQKCLTKKAEGRYATMGALTEDLEKLESGVVPDALGEMMARSGGFNVPADYFRASMPQPMPATPDEPARRSKRPLIIAMGVVATIALAGILITVVKAPSGAAHGPLPASSPVIAATPLGAIPPPSEPASVDVVRSVYVMVDPKDAKVTREGSTENLNAGKSGTVSLDVKDGAKITLVVERDRYRSAKQSIDGTVPVSQIRLDPAASRTSAGARGGGKTTAPASTPSRPQGIDELNDPFAPKK